MHAIFCRRVAVGCSSPQLTKLVTKQASQSRHSLSHLLPFDLSSRFVPPYVVSRSARVHGFFAGKLGNTNLKLKFGNVMESRAGFFSSELPSHGFESGGFTGFQKRGWYRFFSSPFLFFKVKLEPFLRKILSSPFSMVLCFILYLFVSK